MPNNLELTDEAKPNIQFPGGDVSPEDTSRAKLLFSELTIGDRETQISNLNMMRMTEIGIWRSMPGQEEVHGDLKYLDDAWGNTASDPKEGTEIAHVGTFYTLAFIKKSRLLPVRFEKFSDEIMDMSTYDAKTVKFFADEAWSLMHKTHPNIYEALAPFVEHLAKIKHIEDERELELLDAAAVLPYLLASHTRMEGYLKKDLNSHENDERDLSQMLKN